MNARSLTSPVLQLTIMTDTLVNRTEPAPDSGGFKLIHVLFFISAPVAWLITPVLPLATNAFIQTVMFSHSGTGHGFIPFFFSVFSLGAVGHRLIKWSLAFYLHPARISFLYHCSASNSSVVACGVFLNVFFYYVCVFIYSLNCPVTGFPGSRLRSREWRKASRVIRSLINFSCAERFPGLLPELKKKKKKKKNVIRCR